jgi:hypothetical protein
MNQIALVDLGWGGITFAANMLKQKLFNTRLGISIVNLNETIEMIRMDFFWLCG